MITTTISYKMTLRRYMKPVLFIAAFLPGAWLASLCFKKEIVFEGLEVELHD